MEKEETLENKQKLFATAIISFIYAFVIKLTEGITLVAGVHFNIAIFVPAIASILFGRFIGGAGAAGGQLVNSSSSSLLSTGGSASQIALGSLNLTTIVLMLSDFVGAWVVGNLTEKPQEHWDNFVTRFTSPKTWTRLGNNTLGSIIGYGMVNSLIFSYGTASSILIGTTEFVKTFFLNSILLLIFVPITLILFEIGDIYVQVRSYARDKAIRRLSYKTEKENAVTIISTRLVDHALAENTWTPLQLKFRANLEGKRIYRIEAISTANYHPAFDNTDVLEKGDIWEQKFFILPSKQKQIDFKCRITPKLENIEELNQEQDETVVEIKGQSYNPNKNTVTLILFSIINSIMVGASIIWNNLLEFTKNIDNALASLRESWTLIVTTTGLELLIFVPVLWYLRKRWKVGSTNSLKIGFGTDLSERSQKIFNRLDQGVSDIIDAFKEKFQRSVKIFLVFISTVSVIILGLEGYNLLTNPNHKILFADEFLVIALITIVLWIGGFKGAVILKSIGIIDEDKFEVQEGSVIKKFSPTQDFVENNPNEVTFVVENPTDNKGIRLSFLSTDAVSPPLVEVPVPPHEQAEFKTSITPIASGNRDILAVSYPLFDKNGKFIDENTAEPYTHQYINYKVQSQTQIGLSKSQESKLKKLLALVLVFAGLVYGSGFIIKDYIQADFLQIIQNNLIFLLALQGPFIYAYFYLQNKSKIISLEMEDLLDQISAIDVVAKDLNSQLEKSFIKSSTFSKSLTNVMKTSVESMMGLEGGVFRQLNALIANQVKTLDLNKLFAGKANVLKSIDMDLFTGQANEFITSNYAVKIKDYFKDELEKLDSDELPAEEKEKLRQKILIEASNKFSGEIKQDLTKKIMTSFVGEHLDSIVQSKIPKLQKDLKKELKNQLDSGNIIDQVLEKVNEQISPDILASITEQLNSSIFNRQMLSQIAEDLDTQFGSNLVSDFENSIGTALESEMGDKLKTKLQEKYSGEVLAKLNRKLKKQIKKEILKFFDRLIKDGTDNFLETFSTNVSTYLTEKLIDNLDSILTKNFTGILEL